MHTVTKTYRDLPAAHRQPNHDGHCKLIHGHDWRFDITFACDKLDENGFVVDVGKLGAVKQFLEEHFDHTLLLNLDDPLNGRDKLPEMDVLERLSKVILVPNCGMEGLAEFVYNQVDTWSRGRANPRNLHVVEVTCWEDSKNRATYMP